MAIRKKSFELKCQAPGIVGYIQSLLVDILSEEPRRSESSALEIIYKFGYLAQYGVIKCCEPWPYPQVT